MHVVEGLDRLSSGCFVCIHGNEEDWATREDQRENRFNRPPSFMCDLARPASFALLVCACKRVNCLCLSQPLSLSLSP